MQVQQPVAAPVSIGIRFGLLIGLVSILADFIMRLTRPSVLVYGIITVVIAISIAVVGIVLAQRAYRRANGNTMSYGQGVLIAVVALVLSGLISALFNYVYVHYIDPDFVPQMKQQMVDFMERNNVPDDKIAENTSKLDDMIPSFGKALFGGLKNGVVGGLFLGLIVSAFTKRKPADFE